MSHGIREREVPLKMEGKALEVLSEEYVGGTMIGVPM